MANNQLTPENVTRFTQYGSATLAAAPQEEPDGK